MYAPPVGAVPAMVSAFEARWGWVTQASLATLLPSSATWESANRAVYIPILLPVPCVARRVWWANGSTTAGGATIAVGIYANNTYAPTAKLISGSATQGTASTVQFVDITDTSLGAGLYWLAITSSSATNTTIFRSSLANTAMVFQRYDQSSAYPLPATATPAASTGQSLCLFGFATTASP